MSRFLLVCLGGALGSGARYLVASFTLRAFGPGFPLGTLGVNLAGSFVLAAVMTASLSADAVRPEVRLFLTAGVLGGFTTFSSLTWETLALVDGGRAAVAALYLGVSVAGGLAAAVLGALAARAVLG